MRGFGSFSIRKCKYADQENFIIQFIIECLEMSKKN